MMRMRGSFLALTVIMVLGLWVSPVQAQTQPAAPSLLSQFLSKQKPAPLQTRAVTPSSSEEYYQRAFAKAEQDNAKGQAAVMAAQQAESARRLQEVEAMYAAEREKTLAAQQAAAQQLAGGATPVDPQSGVVGGQGVPVKGSAPIRVYAPKKDSSDDKPRRLFNVREQ